MTDTKALTVQESQALEVRAKRELEELLEKDPHLLKMLSHGKVDEGDLAQPPYLKLCQDDDPETGLKAGQYYNTLTMQVYGTAIEVVPLINLTKTRAEYFRPYTVDEPPYCASDTFKDPREPTERRPLQDPKPGPCIECPQASWDDGTPLCSEQSNFMVMLLDDADKLRIMWQRTATKTAKRFRSIMAESGIRKSVIVSAIFAKTDKGKYWVPIVTAGKRLTAVDLLRAARAKQEADNMVKEGLWHIVSADVADFNEANGATPPTTPEAPQDFEGEEPLPFDAPEGEEGIVW